MKTFKPTVTVLIALLVSAQVHAEINTKWVKTGFWQAPQVNEMSVELKPLESDLISACTKYKEIIFSSTGSENWPGQPRRIERFRTAPLLSSPMGVMSFEANFEISNLIDNEYLEVDADLSGKYEIDESKEILPMFTKLKSTTGVTVYNTDQFKIEYLPGALSYSKVSKELGLVESKITIISSRRGSPVLKVEGRDIACDLLQGNIRLTAKTPAYVRLLKSDMNEMESFYHNRLAPKLNKILSASSDSPILKSARLGYHLSKMIEEELNQKDENVIDQQIKGVIDVLFIPKTLDPSKALIEINNKKVINLESSTEAETVTLNFNL